MQQNLSQIVYAFFFRMEKNSKTRKGKIYMQKKIVTNFMLQSQKKKSSC